MSLNYLYLINTVLRDTNEVPLTETNFYTARGFHAFIKEAVNRSFMDIVNETNEWPWLANTPLDREISAHSDEMETERKQAIYEFPIASLEVDWDTFIITDMRGKVASQLQPISYEEWAHYGQADVLSTRSNEDLGKPTLIYKTKDGKGFGLSPVPDKNYRLQYISWRVPSFFENPSDTLPFPDRFYNVLISRVRYYAWLFRENFQQAQMARADYNEDIKKMKQALIKPIFNTMRAI